jgi:hypothetical protein
VSRRAALPLVALGLALGACELGVPTPSLQAADAGLLTVTIVPRGNGAGVVTLDPGGHECPSPGPACAVEVAPGTNVQLRAAPAQGSAFGLWTGVADCGDGDCSFAVTRNVSVSGTLRLPFDLAFVTSTERAPGSLGGRAGADAECTARARAGGYDGTFVALLGDGTPLPGLRGLVRPDGLTVAISAVTLGAGQLILPIAHDELGQRVPEGAKVVTDLLPDLRQLDGDHCFDFDLQTGTVGYGLAGATAQLWVTSGAMGCGDPARLYCVQTDLDVDPPAPPPPAPGTLRAFYYFIAPPVTSGFQPGGGRPTADVACDTLGDAALGASTYVALLATSSDSATARLPDGRTWARFDGPPLGTSAELKAGRLAATLNLNPVAGQTPFYFGSSGSNASHAWIGADDLASPGTAASTCNNWTSSSGRGRVARVSAGLSRFDSDDDCSSSHGLWCLELPPP